MVERYRPRLREIIRGEEAMFRATGLRRTQREELFSGLRDVLAVTAAHPREQTAVFAALACVFPDLDYYNADIPLSLRLAAALAASR